MSKYRLTVSVDADDDGDGRRGINSLHRGIEELLEAEGWDRDCVEIERRVFRWDALEMPLVVGDDE